MIVEIEAIAVIQDSRARERGLPYDFQFDGAYMARGKSNSPKS